MSSEFLANILGINSKANLLNTGMAGLHGSSANGTATGNFEEVLAATVSGQSPAQIVQNVGSSMASILAAISSSYDMTERENLALNYRDAVLQALESNGVNAEAGAEADKITIGGTTYDILRSLNTPGASVAAQLLEVVSGAPGTASGGQKTAEEVVRSTAAANGELLKKFNEATTVEERLAHAEELRDLIVSALNSSGHSAYSYGKIDKIVINGNLFDIFRDLDAVGTPTAIQMMDFGPASDHGITPPAGMKTASTNTASPYGAEHSSAIFAAGASVADILKQISASSDAEERTALAQQFQQSVVQALNGMGFNATALDEADKISVNGIGYDIIRSLNAPGEAAYFQALRLG
jgi:hypothetical protein